MDVNLNLYKYFLAVIEEHGVTNAAAKLGVSQPTVSYNIHALQRELGCELFLVEKDGMVPSAVARALYRRLKPLYTALINVVHDFICSG